jgi:hypothetical protein
LYKPKGDFGVTVETIGLNGAVGLLRKVMLDSRIAPWKVIVGRVQPKALHAPRFSRRSIEMPGGSADKIGRADRRWECPVSGLQELCNS